MSKDDVFSDNIASNNSRIARNTLMLYIRMACIIAISFFTTREVLRALGVDDFGIANVVGGVVSMFQFLGGMLSSAISRYLNYHLGRGDYDGLKKIFNLIRLLNAGLLALIVLLCESVGVFVFHRYLDLPKDSIASAFIFFQFSIFTFAANIATTPYMSLVISRENMKAFSLFSVLEALLKLAIVYALYLDLFGRLEFYGALLFGVSMAHLALYFILCKVKYPETERYFFWDRSKALEIVSFGGWNFFGSISSLFTDVLVNILLNNFFGILVNAARGIVMQLSNAVSSFSVNFMTATRPQIMKYWASENRAQACSLTMKSSKFCFYLVLLFALPAMIEMDFLLKLWLGKVPPYTLVFAELTMLRLLIDSYSTPLVTLVQATGRVALYQCVVGLTLWSTLPVSYLFLKAGFPPESVFMVAIGISILAMFERVLLLRRQTGFPVLDFSVKVVGKSIAAAAISAVLPFSLTFFMPDSAFRFIAVCALSVSALALSVWFVGLDSSERDYVSSSFLRKVASLRGIFS